jgi:hypothetical protein
MHNLGFALEGAWHVLAAGLILGAGLPALFALGVRSLAYGAGASGSAPRPAGTVFGWVLFAMVLAVVLLGITYIVVYGFGKTLSFAHVYPTIVDK